MQESFAIRDRLCWVIAATVAALLVGCSSPGGEEAATSRMAAPLTGPTRVIAGVGVFSTKDPDTGVKGICTGTRIACGVVLTAYHCGNAYGSFQDDLGAPLVLNKTVPIDLAWPPEGQFESSLASNIRDIALMFGNEDCSKLEGRIAKLPDAVGSVDLSEVTISGHGLFAANDGVCQFPDGKGRSVHTSAGAYANYLLTPSSTPTSAGDSGGPLFHGHVLGGAATIVGVLSLGEGGCSAAGVQEMAGKGYFTSLLWEGSPSRQAPLDWIRQEMARHDVDGDGITDDSDNCPGNSNLNQSDRDGDTHGDACDICPCDPHETDPWRDGDGDGVCGLDCSVDGPVPFDNCQGVHNPDQYNCNAEAELARDALPMGDACDPVPCPGFATLPTEYERVAVRFIGGGYVGCIEETLRFELGPIDVRPIGSHGAPGSAKAGDEVPVTPNWTEYRYCVQNLGLGVDCSNPDNIYDPLIRRRADRADERVDDAWHRVWIDELDSPDLVANPIDEGIVYRTGELRSRTWNWLEDFTAWSDTFPAYFSVPSAPIDGRFWAHAQTTVGMTLAADNPHGTGIHPKRLAPDEPADMLAKLHAFDESLRGLRSAKLLDDARDFQDRTAREEGDRYRSPGYVPQLWCAGRPGRGTDRRRPTGCRDPLGRRTMGGRAALGRLDRAGGGTRGCRAHGQPVSGLDLAERGGDQPHAGPRCFGAVGCRAHGRRHDGGRTDVPRGTSRLGNRGHGGGSRTGQADEHDPSHDASATRRRRWCLRPFRG